MLVKEKIAFHGQERKIELPPYGVRAPSVHPKQPHVKSARYAESRHETESSGMHSNSISETEKDWDTFLADPREVVTPYAGSNRAREHVELGFILLICRSLKRTRAPVWARFNSQSSDRLRARTPHQRFAQIS